MSIIIGHHPMRALALRAPLGVFRSTVEGVSLSFQRGQRTGLYVSASVLEGHQLEVLDAKPDRVHKILYVTIDASGWSEPGTERAKQEKYVTSPWPRRREQWTVVVKTTEGAVLSTQRFTFGGPLPGT